uniref:Uncharacterized protein n=1 Tax=Panagrellus redivivus TaxID=6233 RepID=A0A7E5A1D9_PANRE
MAACPEGVDPVTPPTIALECRPVTQKPSRALLNLSSLLVGVDGMHPSSCPFSRRLLQPSDIVKSGTSSEDLPAIFLLANHTFGYWPHFSGFLVLWHPRFTVITTVTVPMSASLRIA